MPTFDMLCAESSADAVLGRDGEVARRLRAETGASVELLVPPPTSLFAFEPADALVARRVPPDRGRDVAVRVSCDDALSTAFSCPAQTCLFRLHARLAAVARDETRAAGARRANRASFLDAFEALQASGASSGDDVQKKRESFFRVLAPRGACDYRSVRERTGANVRVSPYALRANTDLVVIDHHASDAACHVEAMRRVVAALGAFQSGKKRTLRRAPDANQDDSLRGGRHLPPHHPPLPVHVPHAQSTRNVHVAERAFERYGPIHPPPPRTTRSLRRARTGGDGDRSSLEHHSSITLDSEGERRRRRSSDARADASENEKSVVVHLPVPTSLVRFVVGRGGATIQRVRAESGAKVKLHDCAPGAATRFLELGGAIDKVQAARALVVRCLERVVLPPEDEGERDDDDDDT